METELKSALASRHRIWDAFPIHVPASAATFAGFRAWATSDEFPESLRASFISQELVIDMSPEELESHNKVKSEVSAVVATLIKRLDTGEFYGDGTLVTNEAAELSTEPDATFVAWESFEANKVRLVERKDRPDQFIELVGTPDWVLEVVSRSSVKQDTELLLDAYHRAGIPEYWIIDARFDEVSFQILRRRRDRYVVIKPSDGWYRSVVFHRSFRLRRRKNRLGRWAYTLEATTR